MFDHLQPGSGSIFFDLPRRLAVGIRPGQGRPLPSLADVHPGPAAGGRWIGLRTVLTECIRGTASTPDSRGQDFRPLRGREPSDWQSRWSRLMSAAREQVILPPVQLVRAAGDYWVIDGHNRVALAKQTGQLWIDADITEIDVPATKPAAAAAKEH